MKKNIEITCDKGLIYGDLTLPPDSRGMVLFAHGSGSSRFSSRNQFVADQLNRIGFATLLIDLLTVHEESVDTITCQFRFDIDMLAGRLLSAMDWLESEKVAKEFKIGLFGASTGSAAAITAAAVAPHRVSAVVSRGGRPDLAPASLPVVQAPTLLIVGGADTAVIGMNRTALDKLRCLRKMQIVSGAGHLFEEPGALAEVSVMAADWFTQFISSTFGKANTYNTAGRQR